MIRLWDTLKASILIVDDQAANVPPLAQTLRETGNISVAPAKNSHRACELPCENSYSLILIDHLTSAWDGSQAMEGLKAIETEDYLPVLVVTAQPDQKLRHDWRDGHIHPEDRARAFASLSETLERGALSIEYRLKHKSGHNV